MSQPDPLLDRGAIQEAFRRLGERLARRGVVADIDVGSADADRGVRRPWTCRPLTGTAAMGKTGTVQAYRRDYAQAMRQVPIIIEPDLDDPGCATVMVEGTVAGRPYRFILDTGATRTQMEADEYTAALSSVAGETSFSAFGGRSADPVVTITDLAVGSLQAAKLAVTRAGRGGPHVRNLLGMDILQQYCCHFRLEASVLELEAPPGYGADQNLLMSSRGHVYVDVQWPGVTARACWDTGAGATIVNRDFWREHPDLFEEIGRSAGTDSSGAQADTPVLMMTGPLIGQRAFTAHRAVAVDLSHVNSTLEYPMDLILGYPTLRQADWLFDFPAKRWTLTN